MSGKEKLGRHSSWLMGIVVSALLLGAPPLMANATLSEYTVDPTVQYSEADEFGRYVHLIRFAEPGLLDQFRSIRNGNESFTAATPEMQARLADIQVQQQAHIAEIGGTLRRSLDVTHHFTVSQSGIAARLSLEEAAAVARLPNVVAVERERVYELDTFRGPEFIGANAIWDGSAVPSGEELLGAGMVAGVLDSALDAAHPSFANDPACGHGDTVPNKLLSNLNCASTDGNGLCNGPAITPNAHGTHVAGTVLGNFLDPTASPAPALPISGVAPCAHLRHYAVCPEGCPAAQIQAGMDSILLHGDVTVMSFSISGGTNPWLDNDRRKLDLVDAGVFVAASAGNTRDTIPNPVGQVNHRGPWVFTIAASTHDGQQTTPLVSLDGGPQDVAAVQGSGPPLAATYTGQLRWAGDVDPDNILGCDAFPANAFDGEAALISRGDCPFADKVNNAVAAGANFVIVYNNSPDAPGVMGGLGGTTVSSFMIAQAAAQSMITALDGGTAEVTVIPSEVFIEPGSGDQLAGFSLRGPTPGPLQNLQKPDITAPGVSIYAAVPNGYGFLSGTSMSSPHVVGAGLLVAQAQPDWTPVEVRSALQMTAVREGRKDNGVDPWDADDVGSGRADLTRAAFSGLVMHETFANFLAANPAAGGDVRTLNLPAVRDLDCSPECSFTRTVRNVLTEPTSWSVALEGLEGQFTVDISPATFTFTGDLEETQTITVTFAPIGAQNTAINFGHLVFTEAEDASPNLHFTVALSGAEAGPPVASIDATSFNFLLEEDGTNSTTFTISNAGEGELEYSIAEAAPTAVMLGRAQRDGQTEEIELRIDGGIATIINGGNQQWLWMNQFTPSPLDLPFTLEEVDIGFAPNNGGVEAGDLFDIYVWVTPDGDPRTGATLVSQVLGQAITPGVNFQTIFLPGGGVPITVDSGDVLIGVVNRTSRATYSVAVGDSPGNSQQRSWAGLGFPGGIAPTPPQFDQPGFFGLIDEQVAGRNWTIRGYGTGGSACLDPSDVSWLTVAPAAGTIAGFSDQDITVSVDMTGLAVGTYEARLCVTTNDENLPVAVIPVTVEVVSEIQLPAAGLNVANVGFEIDFLSDDSVDIEISNEGTGELLWDLFEPFDVPILPASAERITLLSENFSSEVFPPAGWSRFLIEGSAAAQWQRTTANFNSEPASASRADALGAQNDWLVSPAIELGSAGLLTFVDGGRWMGFYGYSGVMISTDSCDPTDGDFVQLQEISDTPGPSFTTAWRSEPVEIDLSAYANQTVCLAFNYQGDDAHAWLIDDVTVTSEPPLACYDPADVPWLSASPTSGAVEAGAAPGILSLTADADGLLPGLYETLLCVYTNDPNNLVFEVPVSLEVEVPATFATVAGFVQTLGYCSADPSFVEGATVTIAGSVDTFTVTTDADGFYQLFLDAANTDLTITASAPDHFDGVDAGVQIAGGDVVESSFALTLDAACATVGPAELNFILRAEGEESGSLVIGNEAGAALLAYGIQEAELASVPYSYELEGAGVLVSVEGADRNAPRSSGDRLKSQRPMVAPALQPAAISQAWMEGFDDIELLPSAGWAFQNSSSPLGTTDWFQGAPTVFDSHEGAPNSYIGANFNNTAGDGTISNWMMTPEVILFNGAELRFWSRVPTDSAFADRLEVRLSTSGGSTDVGTDALDVGDFDTLLLTINENLTVGDYPEVWTEFVVTVEGLDAPTTGRFAFRYFVTSGGPFGDNSSYIGIDTVSFTPSPAQLACFDPGNVPWLTVSPFFGNVAPGETADVSVTVDSTGLAPGRYQASVCVNTDDEQAPLFIVPVRLDLLGDELFWDRFEAP